MPGFLNSAIAKEEEEQQRTAEIVQARAERDVYKAQCQALEGLVKHYGNQVVDLQVRIALLELRLNG